MAQQKYYFDFTAASATVAGTGTAPFAGSSTVGGGSGWLDMGDVSTPRKGQYYRSGTSLANAYTGSSPGTYLFDSVNNGLVRSSGTELIQDGQVWIQHNGTNKLGVQMRCDPTGVSQHGIGALIEGGTFYIWIKNASGSTVDFPSQAVGTSVPADARLKLKCINSGSTVNIRVAMHTAASFDPSNSANDPDAATEAAVMTYAYNASGNTAVLAAGAVGVFSYNNGSIKSFASYAVSTALAATAPNLVDRGSKCITININEATGGTGVYTRTLQRAVVDPVTLLPGAYSNLATVSIGNYDDTAITPGVIYSYRVSFTDTAPTTVVSTAIQARALLTTEPLFVIGAADSQQDTSFGTVTPRFPTWLSRWFAGFNVDSWSKSFAVAGTTSANWTPTGTQAATLAAAVAWGNKYGANMYMVMLGTNDSKTAVATTQTAFANNIAAIEGYIFANATTSPKVLYSTPPFINGASVAGGEWDVNSDARLLSYVTAMQGREGTNVKLMDNPTRTTSFHDRTAANPSIYNLVTDPHMNGFPGHADLQLACCAGYFGPLYASASGSGSGRPSTFGGFNSVY